MHLPHLWHFAPHLPHLHLSFRLADVALYGGGTVAVRYGLLVAVASPTTFDFNGLAGLVVALTGLVGMLGGLWTNAQKNRLEQVKLGVESLRKQNDQQANEILRLRSRQHKMDQVVTVLDVERQSKGMTPDPDRPLFVEIVNPPDHPVPTRAQPAEPEGGGRA